MARQQGLLEDYDNEQLEILNENIQNVAQVARMRALGRDRWTMDDYKLAFAIKSGQVKLPPADKPLWMPEAHMLEPDDDKSVQRGLFNVKRWIGSQKTANYLQKNQDPFPDLPNLGGWDTFTGGSSKLLPIHSSGAGFGSSESRFDLVPKKEMQRGNNGN